MSDSTLTTVARSAEPNHLVYLIRRLLVLSALVVAGLLVTGQLPVPGSTPVDSTTTGTQDPAISSASVEGGTDDPAAGDGPTERVPVDGTTDDGITDEGTTDRGVTGDGTTDEGPSLPGLDGTDQPGSGPAGEDPASVPGQSRLLEQPPGRVLDTRTGGPSTAATTHVVQVPEGRTAVALLVSIIDSIRDGAVFIDGRAGVVEAVSVGQAGATATNLVFVPVAGTELTVRSSSGGDLVVDLVGTFEPSQRSASGRFVATDLTRINRLETAVDGRETELTFDTAVPPGQADAFLVLITADVGADGGVIRLGTGRENVDQALRWSAAVGENPQRRGLALITPGPDGSASLRYDGGSLLTVDVVGYFSSEGQDVSTDGLYVPNGPRRLFNGTLTPDPVQVDGVERRAESAVVIVTERSAPLDQAWSVLVPVVRGTTALSWPASIEADVVLLGVFL